MTDEQRLSEPDDHALTGLSAKEIVRATDIARRFDPRPSNAILQFGVAAQRRMADLMASISANVQMAGAALNRNARTDEISSIVGRLRHTRQALLADLARFDMFHVESAVNFRELLVYIRAGEIKLGELQRELAESGERAAAGSSLIDNREARARVDAVRALDARVYDLKLAAIIARQTAARTRLLQLNGQVLIETITIALKDAHASIKLCETLAPGSCPRSMLAGRHF